MVPAVFGVTQHRHREKGSCSDAEDTAQLRVRRRSSAQGCGGWWVTGGLEEVGICNRLGPSLLSVLGLSPFPSDGSERQPGLRRWLAAMCRRAAWLGAAALALMRFVVIGNWTAKEPGSCFYGNVLEQQTREEKNRRYVNGSC